MRNLPSQGRLGSLLTVRVLLQLILGQNFLPEDENFDPVLNLLLRVIQSHQVATLILHYKVVTGVRIWADIVKKNVGCDDKINIRPANYSNIYKVLTETENISFFQTYLLMKCLKGALFPSSVSSSTMSSLSTLAHRELFLESLDTDILRWDILNVRKSVRCCVYISSGSACQHIPRWIASTRRF